MVADLMRTNVRTALVDNFEEFLSDSAGVEALCCLTKCCSSHNAGEDIAEEFRRIMDLQEIYVRVPWRHKERIQEFVGVPRKGAGCVKAPYVHENDSHRVADSSPVAGRSVCSPRGENPQAPRHFRAACRALPLSHAVT
jgi:hypothetical protein